MTQSLMIDATLVNLVGSFIISTADCSGDLAWCFVPFHKLFFDDLKIVASFVKLNTLVK